MAPESDENPLEQLVDLFVYAPVGMLYEYPEVLPRLIKRGKSQVKLAKFVGQLALKQQQGGLDSIPIPADAVAGVLARIVTEIGAAVGLAPGQESPIRADPKTDDFTDTDKPASQIPDRPEPTRQAVTKSSQVKTNEVSRRLPIASYDDLTAKEVIFLLDDLTVSQLRRVRDYEHSKRGRKTVLGKIDRLLS